MMITNLTTNQTTGAIDVDGGQQGASFPEQNERKSSPAASW